MGRRVKKLEQPVVIRLSCYGNFPVLLFNDADVFLQYVESHNMVDDLLEGFHLEQNVHNAEGLFGALKHETQEGDNHGTVLDEEYVYYILINKPTIEVVSHEVCHLVINIFTSLGMEVNVHTQEAFCYAQDHLLSVVCDKLGITKFSPVKY